MSRLLFGAIGCIVLFACDSGNGTTATTGAGGSGETTSSANVQPTTTTTGATMATGTTTGTMTTTGGMTSTGSGAGAIMCPMNYCSGIGMGGYAFAYADGDAPATPTGTSMSTLDASGALCISGNTMALPAMPTAADYSNDWGAGIGVNLNQAMATGMMSPPMMMYTPSSAGVTITTSGVPACTSARVVVDSGGMDYCAALVEGTMIPWTSFNTKCYDPTPDGTALAGPPTGVHIEIQLTTSMTACTFSEFCINALSL